MFEKAMIIIPHFQT